MHLARPEGGAGMRSTVAGLKDVPREDMLVHGHGACPGCGYAATARNIARILGPETVAYVPASCLAVFGALYPTSAWKIPYLYTAFENTGAVITGLKAAYRRRGIKANVVGMAGDGGTFDIGLQALSGAAERNEDVIYVCLDNEAYMNTGIQRSSATPFGAWTTTTPAGAVVAGNRRFKKDIAAIVAQHNVPYVATLSVAHFSDFVRKVEKARDMSGFRFLHCLTPCVPGWRIEPANGGFDRPSGSGDGDVDAVRDRERSSPRHIPAAQHAPGDRLSQPAGSVQAHLRRGRPRPPGLVVPKVEGSLRTGRRGAALRDLGQR